MLLQPRTIHALLGCGGILLMSGMIVWLASIGVFDDPLVVAASLGAGTVFLLGSGIFAVRQTDFPLAGRAVALLACLIMPLNLWFYHAHDLLSVQGQLWIAAAVCCGLYALTACVLRDPLFAYVLLAGISATGALFLADLDLLTRLPAPSLMLCSIGVLAIHAERAFPVSESSAFSRDRFGRAFFRSGQASLSAGLVVLLASQLDRFVLAPVFGADLGVLGSSEMLPFALTSVLAGTWSYAYSARFTSQIANHRRYVYGAALTLLWAELIGLRLLGAHFGAQMLLITLAISATIVEATDLLVARRQSRFAATSEARTLAVLSDIFSTAALLVGGGMLAFGGRASVGMSWHFQLGTPFLAAIALVTFVSHVAALRRQTGRVAIPLAEHRAALALLVLIGAFATRFIDEPALRFVLLVPVSALYLLPAMLRGNAKSELRDSTWSDTAAVSSLALLVCAIPAMLNGGGGGGHALVAAFFAELAVVHAVIASLHSRRAHGGLAFVFASVAAWQATIGLNIDAQAYLSVCAAAGALLLGASRIRSRFTGTLDTLGNISLLIGFFGSFAMVAVRLLAMSTRLSHALTLGAVAASTLIASTICGRASEARAWRRPYLIMSVLNGLMAAAVVAIHSSLSMPQKFELGAIATGLFFLVAGHVGLLAAQAATTTARPRGAGESTALLWLGSLLAGFPMLIAVIVHRIDSSVSIADETGLITAGAAMLLAGLILRVRSTTLVGGGLLATHLLILLAFVGWQAQFAVGVYLASAGAALFLCGLALAVYRERLLTLPRRFHDREGLFQVLSWR